MVMFSHILKLSSFYTRMGKKKRRKSLFSLISRPRKISFKSAPNKLPKSLDHSESQRRKAPFPILVKEMRLIPQARSVERSFGMQKITSTTFRR